MRKILDVFRLKKEKEPVRCEMHCRVCRLRCCVNCISGDAYTEATGDPRNRSYRTVTLCDFQPKAYKKSAPRYQCITACEKWKPAYPAVFTK